MSAEPSRAAPNAARWYRHVAAILDERFPGDATGIVVRAALAGGAKPAYTVDWHGGRSIHTTFTRCTGTQNTQGP